VFKNLLKNEKVNEFRESLYYYIEKTFMPKTQKKLMKEDEAKAKELTKRVKFVLKIIPEN